MVWQIFNVFCLAKMILQGTAKGKNIKQVEVEGRRWEDSVKEWSGMDFASQARTAEDRIKWKGIVSQSSAIPKTFCKFIGECTHCGCLLICHTYILSSTYQFFLQFWYFHNT